MADIIELTTSRLRLRQWQASDRLVFSQMNADPDVMQFYPALLSTEDSHAMAARIEHLIAQQGWGLWALELIKSGEFIGFTGLHHPDDDIPCAPCVEIGWRLSRDYWGNGYATEAGVAALDFAFEQLHCHEVFSFASINNLKSQAVMQRLGMRNTGRNFEHPKIPAGHPLREHVLYHVSPKDKL